MTPTPDTIEIRKLQVATHIGVPDQERMSPQTLLVSIRMIPAYSFDGLGDEIFRTVDYHQVAMEVVNLAASRVRNLIETLALDIVHHLLNSHPLCHVAVTVEKYILPDTECVAVHVERYR